MSTTFAEIDKVTNLHKNNELQLLCFKLENNDSLYAINVFKVREVIKHKGEVIKVEHESFSLIDGLITVRDMTMPIIDLRKWFHYNSSNPRQDLTPYAIESEESIFMVCDFSRFTVGIKIFSPERILGRKWEEIDQSENVGVNTDSGKLISRTKYYDGRIVQIVDVEKMLVDAFPWIEEEKMHEIENLKELHIQQKEILVADDSKSVIKIMQKILNKLDVNYRIFQNGQELLDYAFDESTDIGGIGFVITDLEMPVTSGFEVIKQLKNNPLTKHLKVAVNSSMSGESNEEMARSLNADEFMSKSNPEEIADLVKKYLL